MMCPYTLGYVAGGDRKHVEGCPGPLKHLRFSRHCLQGHLSGPRELSEDRGGGRFDLPCVLVGFSC